MGTQEKVSYRLVVNNEYKSDSLHLKKDEILENNINLDYYTYLKNSHYYSVTVGHGHYENVSIEKYLKFQKVTTIKTITDE